MGACKAVRVELGGNAEWWRMFYSKILHYQNGLTHSNFRRSLLSLTRVYGDRKQKLLKVLFSRQCCFCNARFGHKMVPAFGIRVCPTPCLRDNLVSNIALYFRYGVAFSDFVRDSSTTTMLAFHAQQLRVPNVLCRLTVDAWDHYHVGSRINYWGPVCFFLRHEVEQRVRLDEAAQQQRRGAAQFLTARLIRAIHHRTPLECAIRQHRGAMQRQKMYPALPSPYWMPGGPCLAVTRHFALVKRAGFDDKRIYQLKQITETAQKESGRHI
jgi:hypothetical protein